MEKYLRKIISAFVIILSSVFVLAGCGQNKYNNLKLSLYADNAECVEKEIELSDSDSENTFALKSVVKGFNGRYKGNVIISKDTSPAIKFVGKSSFSGGVTTQNVMAVQDGTSLITVKTVEGSVIKTLKVTVYKPVTSINWNKEKLDNAGETEPKNFTAKLGNTIDFNKLIYFPANDPSSASKRKFNYVLSVDENGGELETLKQMQKEVNETGKLVVNENCLKSFNIVAVNAFNSDVKSEVLHINTINFIEKENITIYKNGIEIAKNVNSQFEITMPSNIKDLSDVELSFTNMGGSLEDYIIKVKYNNREDFHLTSDNRTFVIGAVGDSNVFKLSALETTIKPEKISFVFYKKDLIGHDSLKTVVDLKININTFADSVIIEDAQSNPKTEIPVYKEIKDKPSFEYSTKIKVYAAHTNDNSEKDKMFSKQLKFMVAPEIEELIFGDNPLLTIINASSGVLKNGDLIDSGTELYIKHNFPDDLPTPDINLMFVSSDFNEFKEEFYSSYITKLKINIIKGEIDLKTNENVIKINLLDENNGLRQLEILNLPKDFNFKDLQVKKLNDGFNSIIIEHLENGIFVKAERECTGVKIIVRAGNGSEVEFEVSAFRELSSDIAETSITFPNGQILPYNKIFVGGNQTSTEIIYPKEIILKNGETLNFAVKANSKKYPFDSEIIKYSVSSTNPNIVSVNNGTQLVTKNSYGKAEVTFKISGYDSEGNKENKLIEFKLIVNVEIRAFSISNNNQSLQSQIYAQNFVIKKSYSREEYFNLTRKVVNIRLNPTNVSFRKDLDIEPYVNGYGQNDEYVSYDYITIPGYDISDKGIKRYEFTLDRGKLFIEIPYDYLGNATINNKDVTIYGNINDNSDLYDSVIFDIEFAITQRFNDFYTPNNTAEDNFVTHTVKSNMTISVKNPIRVRSISTEVANQTINFDARDFDRTDNNILEGGKYAVVAEKSFKVSIFPLNALNKKIKVFTNSEYIKTSIEVVGSYCYVTIKIVKVVGDENSNPNSHNGPIEVFVVAEDSRKVNDESDDTNFDYKLVRKINVVINDGSIDNPFLIRKESDFLRISAGDGLMKHYALANDIYFSEGFDGLPIKGTFKGTITGIYSYYDAIDVDQRKTIQNKIYNLNLNVSNINAERNFGLFERLDGATISNLIFYNSFINLKPYEIDVEISSSLNVGFIAGVATNNTKIINCAINGLSNTYAITSEKLSAEESGNIVIDVSETKKVMPEGTAEELADVNLFVGGFVGSFEGEITNSSLNIGVVIKTHDIKANKSTLNVGGFVGRTIGTKSTISNKILNNRAFAPNIDIYINVIDKVTTAIAEPNYEDEYKFNNAVAGVVGNATNTDIVGVSVSPFISADVVDVVAGVSAIATNLTLNKTLVMPILSGKYITAGLIGILDFNNGDSHEIKNNNVEFVHKNSTNEIYNIGLKSENIVAGLVGFVRSNFNKLNANNAVLAYNTVSTFNQTNKSLGDLYVSQVDNNAKNIAGFVYKSKNLILVNNQIIANVGYENLKTQIAETEFSNYNINLNVSAMVGVAEEDLHIFDSSASVNLLNNFNGFTVEEIQTKVQNASTNIAGYILDASNINKTATVCYKEAPEADVNDPSNDFYVINEFNYVLNGKFYKTNNINIQNSFVNLNTTIIDNDNICYLEMNKTSETAFVGKGYSLKELYRVKPDETKVYFDYTNVTIFNSLLNLETGNNPTGTFVDGSVKNFVTTTETNFINVNYIEEIKKIVENEVDGEIKEETIITKKPRINLNLLETNSIYAVSGSTLSGLNEADSKDENLGILAKWYFNADLNNGLITNLSPNKFITTDNEGVKQNKVDLLSNFSPSDIKLIQNSNNQDIWLQELAKVVGTKNTILYFYSLDKSNYDKGLLDFSEYPTLTKSQKITLNNNIHQVINNNNLYDLNDVLSYYCVPPFLDTNKTDIQSSNTNVLNIIVESNKKYIKVNGVGSSVVTISSLYNKTIKVSFTIDVCNAVDNFNIFKNQTYSDKLLKSETINVLTGNIKTLYANNYSLIRFENVPDGETDNLYSFEFKLSPNENGGTRFIVAGKNAENKFVKYNQDADLFTSDIIGINGISKFKKYGNMENGYFYMDIDNNENIKIEGIKEGDISLFAVPYINIKNQYSDVEGNLQTETNKIVLFNTDLLSYKKEVDSDNGFNFFTVSVNNGTNALKADKTTIELETNTTEYFDIQIHTAEQKEILFISYLENNGNNFINYALPISFSPFTDNVYADEELLAEQNYDASKLPSDFNAEDLEKYNKFSSENNTLTVGMFNIKLLAEPIYENGIKTYSFAINCVADEEKISKIEDILNLNVTFFTVDFNSEIDNQLNSTLRIREEDINYKANMSFVLNPPKVSHFDVLHYPNGELELDEFGGQTPNVDYNEVAFNNLVAGNEGILKINIYPWYGNFKYVDILVKKKGNENASNKMAFTQKIAQFDPEDGHLIKYHIYNQQNTIVENDEFYGIRLDKFSYQNSEGKYFFNGMLYVSTRVPTNVPDNEQYTIYINGYNYNSRNVINAKPELVFGTSYGTGTNPTVLTVVKKPEIELEVKGGKNAPVAIGTYIDINVKQLNIESGIKFSAILEHETISIESKYITGTKNILRVKCPNVPVGSNIKIVAEGTKVVNNITLKAEDRVYLQVALFVIDGIYVQNTHEGKMVGLFNQIHLLSIKIKATFDRTNLATVNRVKAQLERLSYELTYRNADEIDNLYKHYYVRKKSNGFITDTSISNSNDDKANFRIMPSRIGDNANGLHALYIRNLVFNSKDIIVAKLKVKYEKFVGGGSAGSTENIHLRDAGITIIENDESGNQSGNNDAEISNYTYKYESEFGFGFFRLSNEDNPMPIPNETEFINVLNGDNEQNESGNSEKFGDFILTNDLVLENWEPKAATFRSLDGNSHIITIKSFDLRNIKSNDEGANIGLFSTIAESTIVKNLNIKISLDGALNKSLEKAPNDTSISSRNVLSDVEVDATKLPSANFGVLAGTNNGIVTNCNVNYTFDDLIEIRNKMYDQYPEKDPLKELTELGNESATRDLAIVKLNSVIESEGESNPDAEVKYNVAGLVGVNSRNAYITNSSVENVSIYGVGNVAGLVATNNGKISSSYYKGANVVNFSDKASQNAGTAGLVVRNGGSIQYSYAEGREGNYISEFGTDNVIIKDRKIESESDTADKTNINKKDYVSYDLKEYYAKPLNKQSSVNKKVLRALNLRAMNSAVIAAGNVAGFIYENTGLINNSYANFMVYSSNNNGAGFVYKNGGNIEDTYSLSAIKVDLDNYSPFVGFANGASGAPNNEANATIAYSLYLKLGKSINDPTVESNGEDIFIDKFNDKNEIATGIGADEFKEYNSFQGYAFNRDLTKNEEIDKSVWYIEKNSVITTDKTDTYKNKDKYIFKTYSNIVDRPQLVSANLRTISYRIQNNSATDKLNSYVYLTLNKANAEAETEDEKIDPDDLNDFEKSRVNLYGKGTLHNPYLVRDSNDFNVYMTESVLTNSETKEAKYNKGINTNERIFNNDIRFVSDIKFDENNLIAKTYNVAYAGNLDGNGMDIDSIRIVADSSIEEDASGIFTLGLFGRIVSIVYVQDVYNGYKVVEERGILKTRADGSTYWDTNLTAEEVIRGNVRNLNLRFNQVVGPNVDIVGGLAGEIINASVANITIKGENDVRIEGSSAVGGLAGYVGGTTEITNVTTSISVLSNCKSGRNEFNEKVNINAYSTGYNVFEEYSRAQDNGGVANAASDTIVNNLKHNYWDNLPNVTWPISYVGGAIGIANTKSNRQNNENLDQQNIRSNALRKIRTIGSTIEIKGENVGGVVGLIGDSTTSSDLIFEVQSGAKPKLNASAVAGGVVAENRGQIQRSYISLDDKSQKSYDEAVKKFIESVSNSSVNSLNFQNSLRYSNLFIGNPHYMGGLIGFNNDGVIKESYSRIDVENIDAKFAGGIIGLNVGGIIRSVYTTSNVKSYLSMGGAIGLQLSANSEDVNKINIKHTYPISPEDEVDNENLLDAKPDFMYYLKYLYINNYSSFLTKADLAPTLMSNVVASPLWKSEVTNNTYKKDIGRYTPLGGLIGTLEIREASSTNNYLEALKDSILVDNSDRRAMSESVYFIQPKDASNIQYNEIGCFVGNVSNGKEIYRDGHNYQEFDDLIDNLFTDQDKIVTQNGKRFYRTGVYEPEGLTTYYKYSRMFNIGSARTYLEIIRRTYIQEQGLLGNEEIIESSQPEEDRANDKTRYSIYQGFSSRFWRGVSLSLQHAIPDAEKDIVYPYLSQEPELYAVEVWETSDLNIMKDNLYADFILMQDIVFTNKETWDSVGDESSPFEGRIYSNPEDKTKYTIDMSAIQPIQSKNGLTGFIACSRGATFSNFILKGIQMETPTGGGGNYQYMGSLVAKALDLDSIQINTFNNVTIINPSLVCENAVAVGGLVGYTNSAKIINCNVINESAASDSDFNINATFTKDPTTSIGVGGLVGVYDNLVGEFGEQTEIIANVNVVSDADSGNPSVSTNANSGIDRVSENVKNISIKVTSLEFSNDNAQFNVGGLVGTFKDTLKNTELVRPYKLNAVSTSNVIIVTNASTKTFNKNVNLGGLIGYAENVALNINSNGTLPENNPISTVENTTIKTAADDLKFAAELNVGGAFGNLVDCSKVASIKVKNVNIQFNGTTDTNNNAVNIGGAFGNIEAIGTSEGTDANSDSGATSYNISTNSGAEKIAVSGDINSNISGGIQYIGGLIGNNKSTIKMSLSNTNIYNNVTGGTQDVDSTETNFAVAGFVGQNIGTIVSSYATGTVDNKYLLLDDKPKNESDDEDTKYIAGFVGVNSSAANIQNCYTISPLITTLSTGGKSIKNFKNTYRKGGFVGGGNIAQGNYYNADINPYTNVADKTFELDNLPYFRNSNAHLLAEKLNSTVSGNVWVKSGDEGTEIRFALFADGFFGEFQGLGSKQNPTSDITGDLKDKAIIYKNQTNNALNLVNTIVYGTQTSTTASQSNNIITAETGGVLFNSIDRHSVVVGLTTLNTNNVLATKNEGVIISTNLKYVYSGLVATNSGIMFDTKLNFVDKAISQSNIGATVLNSAGGAIYKLVMYANNNAGSQIQAITGDKDSCIEECAIHALGESRLGIAGTHTIINSYTAGTNAGHEYYYMTNGEQGYSIGTGTIIDSVKSDLLTSVNNLGKFDLDVYTLFAKNGSINNGAPVLLYELKSNWYNYDIDASYYVSEINLKDEISQLTSKQFTENKLFIPIGLTKVADPCLPYDTPVKYTEASEDVSKIEGALGIELNGSGVVTNANRFATIEGLVIVLNKSAGVNAGIFASINAPLSVKNLIFRNNIVINGANNKSTGLIAGEVVNGTSDTNSLTMEKVAIENNIVISPCATGRVAGFVGNNRKKALLTDVYSYMDNVLGGNNTAGFLNNISDVEKNIKSAATINTSYYASKVNNTEISDSGDDSIFNDIINASVLSINDSYVKQSSVVEGSQHGKTEEQLQYEKLEGFNWSDVWARTNENNNYPNFISYVDFWINHTENVNAGTITITTPEQLAAFAVGVNAGTADFDKSTVTLGANINLENYIWTPIGTTDKPFKGTFNFNGYYIENVNCYGNYSLNGDAILRNENVPIGLFGLVDGAIITANVDGAAADGGCLRNAVVYNKDVEDNLGTGLLVGFAKNSTINYITAYNSTIYGTNNAGGLVGLSEANTISDSKVNAKIYGTDNVGGIVGYARTKTKMFNVKTNNGNIIKGNSNVGGAVGKGVIILDNTDKGLTYLLEGNVNGANYVGGIAGILQTGSWVEGVNSSVAIAASGSNANKGSIAAEAEASVVIREIKVSNAIVSTVGSGDTLTSSKYTQSLVHTLNTNYLLNVEGSYKTGDTTSESFCYVNNSNVFKNVSGSPVAVENSDTKYLTYSSVWDVNDGVYKLNYSKSANIKTNRMEYISDDSYYSLTANNISISSEDAWKCAVSYNNKTPDNIIPKNVLLKENITLNIVKNPRAYQTAYVDFVLGNEIYKFKNVFDGNNKTITINSFESMKSQDSESTNGQDYVGLFGYIEGATVQNLVVSATTGVTIEGENNVGLIGYAGASSTIANITNNVSINGTNNIGGIVGQTLSNIQACKNTGAISGASFVGGIAGLSTGGAITGSETANVFENEGAVSATGSHVAGIVGKTDSSITNCKNKGNVSASSEASEYVAGIVGETTSNIQTCKNTGAINGGSYVGGIAGLSTGGAITGLNDKTVFENEGSVTGSGSYIAGIVGKTDSSITNCKNKGNVLATSESSEYVAGVAGYFGTETTVSTSETQVETKLTGIADVSSFANEGNVTVEVTAANGSDITLCGNYIGGIVGYANKPIENVQNKGSIRGDSYVGGIAGKLEGVALTGSNNVELYVGNGGNVTASGDYVGGVVGKTNSEVKNFSNSGNIVGNCYVGGIVGNNELENSTTATTSDATTTATNNILACYNSGSISGNSYIGGIAGSSYGVVSGTTDIKSTPGAEAVLVNNGSVSGIGTSVGGVVGCTEGLIIYCINNMSVKTTSTNSADIGGVVGRSNSNKTILCCENSGSISGGGDANNSDDIHYGIGGIAGCAENNSFKFCYNSGSVSAGDSKNNAGGVVGYTAGNIESCKNSQTVSGKDNVGGLVGINFGDDSYIRGFAYESPSTDVIDNTGDITGTNNNIGGIAGYTKADVSKCANSGNVKGVDNVAGIVGKTCNNVLNCSNYGQIVANIISSGIVACVEMSGRSAENPIIIEGCMNYRREVSYDDSFSVAPTKYYDNDVTDFVKYTRCPGTIFLNGEGTYTCNTCKHIYSCNDALDMMYAQEKNFFDKVQCCKFTPVITPVKGSYDAFYKTKYPIPDNLKDEGNNDIPVGRYKHNGAYHNGTKRIIEYTYNYLEPGTEEPEGPVTEYRYNAIYNSEQNLTGSKRGRGLNIIVHRAGDTVRSTDAEGGNAFGILGTFKNSSGKALPSGHLVCIKNCNNYGYIKAPKDKAQIVASGFTFISVENCVELGKCI